MQTLTRKGIINTVIPWHVKNVWGYHEDFHLILVIAHTFTSHLYDTLFQDNNDKGDWVVVSQLIPNADHARVAYEAVERTRVDAVGRIEGVREGMRERVGSLGSPNLLFKNVASGANGVDVSPPTTRGRMRALKREKKTVETPPKSSRGTRSSSRRRSASRGKAKRN